MRRCFGRTAKEPLVQVARPAAEGAESPFEALKRNPHSVDLTYEIGNRFGLSPSEMDSATDRERRLLSANAGLVSQLEVQFKVNEELKRMLVSFIGGETHATRIEQLLTDRCQLLNRITELDETVKTGQSQLTRLNSHCDTWRSKYLASQTIAQSSEENNHLTCYWLNILRMCLLELKHERDVINKNMSESVAKLNYLLKLLHSDNYKTMQSDVVDSVTLSKHLNDSCQHLTTSLLKHEASPRDIESNFTKLQPSNSEAFSAEILDELKEFSDGNRVLKTPVFSAKRHRPVERYHLNANFDNLEFFSICKCCKNNTIEVV